MSRRRVSGERGVLSKAEGKGRYGGRERVSISFLQFSNDNRQKVLRTGEEGERGTVSRTRLWVYLGLPGPCRSLLVRSQIERSYKGFSERASSCLSPSQSNKDKTDQELELGGFTAVIDYRGRARVNG